MPNPFLEPFTKPDTVDGIYSEAERGLANRNHGLILETLKLDTTPIGAHYLLSHFDVPLLESLPFSKSIYRTELPGSNVNGSGAHSRSPEGRTLACCFSQE